MNQTATSHLMTATTTDADAEIDDFESVVAFYRPKIFRFAFASMRDADLAATVTQDCFVNAYKARGRFRNECSMDTWLMRIVVNLIRDHARNRRLQFWRRTNLTAMPIEAMDNLIDHCQRSPETHALLKERVEAVWHAAAVLPERQRTVFLLRFVEDMDLLEIAAVTGLKEGTVKTHLFRALESVRKRLGVSA